MVGFSAIVHIIMISSTMVVTSFTPRRYLESGVPGPMNVMWAKTVQAPKQSRPDKLPGPIVRPAIVPPKKEEKAKVVMPGKDTTVVKKNDKAEQEELDRQKAMADALASVQKDLEGRPTPRPDNFPSTGAGEEGLPGGPGGVAGILGGDPIFGGYKRQVQQVITDNFVWIQKKDGASSKLATEISFRIDGNGNIIDPTVSQGSGNVSFDAAAMRAIRKSSPLPAPPSDLANDIVREQFGVRFRPDMK
jgi:TonB family protein